MTVTNAVGDASGKIVFPVIGNTNYSDTFLAFRPGQVENKHHAIDIFGPKHSLLVSPVDGMVTYVGYPQDPWGWNLTILGNDGYRYEFIHINNDTPGTDDGTGGPMHAYAPDMKVGNRVVKGQFIGYLGVSGNAENTPPHLHIEMIKPEYVDYEIYRDIPLAGFENPYPYLVNAIHIANPVTYPALSGEGLPFGPHVNRQLSLAAGSFSGSGKKTEYVVGVGPGSAPQVRIFNANDSVRDWGFFAYNTSYRGGVNVATGDIDGDAIDEIATGTNEGSTTHVKVFRQNGSTVSSFFAYPGYYTGVNVALDDLDNDGETEIITGTGYGSTSHVKIFTKDGIVKNSFFAYPGYYTGADVATGDVDGDGKKEIITSTSKGSRAHIKIFDTNGKIKYDFFAYGQGFFGGAQVAVAQIDPATQKLEILVAPRFEGGPDFRVYDEKGVLLNYSGQLSDRAAPWEAWWSGTYDIAGLETNDKATIKVGTGDNRRSSVRSIQF